MADIEQFLARVRAHLEVQGERADEICEEVRRTMQARLEQYRSLGLARDEAAEATANSFGDPRQMAAKLSAANYRYQRLTPFRALLAFTLVGVCLVALVGSADIWDRGVSQWATENAGCSPTLARNVLLVVLAMPVATLAGLIAGRRYFWISGLPALLWGVLLGALSLGSTGATSYALVMAPLVGGLVLAAFGAVGARALGAAAPRRAVIIGCGAYAALAALGGLIAATGDAVGVLAAAASAEAGAGLLGLAALLRSPAGRRRTLPGAAIAWALCAAAVIASGIDRASARSVSRWAMLAGTQGVVWVAVFFHYRAAEAREQTARLARSLAARQR